MRRGRACTKRRGGGGWDTRVYSCILADVYEKWLYWVLSLATGYCYWLLLLVTLVLAATATATAMTDIRRVPAPEQLRAQEARARTRTYQAAGGGGVLGGTRECVESV